ncbi:hypothetical protein Aab01nite_67080 [Paractinoplanes abujensis]|uniref:Uncharacterized protein n=1 Tax=Paractinoplanes abujensis TaxID=882441 RepID=A0A7W7CVM5_9ACTN|nr:hypothetical protein [Actinoplanes abujensis]GID23118.1 hypothetical protein Aab01nite_67080 [Actinoplanes abujensis]
MAEKPVVAVELEQDEEITIEEVETFENPGRIAPANSRCQ